MQVVNDSHDTLIIRGVRIRQPADSLIRIVFRGCLASLINLIAKHASRALGR